MSLPPVGGAMDLNSTPNTKLKMSSVDAGLMSDQAHPRTLFL